MEASASALMALAWSSTTAREGAFGVGYRNAYAELWNNGSIRETDLADKPALSYVKASATVRSDDFAGLRTWAEACGECVAQGVVLHDGAEFVPFAERLAAAAL